MGEESKGIQEIQDRLAKNQAHFGFSKTGSVVYTYIHEVFPIDGFLKPISSSTVMVLHDFRVFWISQTSVPLLKDFEVIATPFTQFKYSHNGNATGKNQNSWESVGDSETT